MRRQEINYDRVASAATRIKKQGREPSVTDVCDELGILRAPPELSTLLERWYHNQPDFKRVNIAPLTENIRVHAQNSTVKKKTNKNELEKSPCVSGCGTMMLALQYPASKGYTENAN